MQTEKRRAKIVPRLFVSTAPPSVSSSHNKRMIAERNGEISDSFDIQCSKLEALAMIDSIEQDINRKSLDT